jgi:hypothetical protein
MSMQSGLGRPAAGARRAGIGSQGARVCALLLSLAASACANIGQIGNLTEGRGVAVAFESVDGPPAAVLHKFVNAFKEEAGVRQIAVVAPGEATYRLRGYLATHADAGGTVITWAWDVYDANQRRAFRLGGAERAAGSERNRWAGADDQVLRKIARTGIEQFAAFMASGRAPQVPAVASAPTPPAQSRSTFAWLDDWAPEAFGIFRTLRSEPPRSEDKIETANLTQARDIPLPKGRPAPTDDTAESTLAFAASDH